MDMDAQHPEAAAHPPHAFLVKDTSAASSVSIHELPPPPVPSSDPNLATVAANGSPPVNEEDHDLFKLPAAEALRLLSTTIELLVCMTGDVPPTPPPRMPTDPQMSGLQAEKANIVRSHSEKNLARLRLQQQQQQQQQNSSTKSDNGNHHASAAVTVAAPVTGKRPSDQEHEGKKAKLQAYSAAMSAKLADQAGTATAAVAAAGPETTDEIDGVVLKPQALLRHRSPPTAPPTSSSSSAAPSPYIIIGSDSQPINLQHGAITRKFYSKNEPPISIGQYLLRLHQFCPMSSAVYLAASLYIHRLAVEQRAIPVTRRNAHRLVLAGLRVAMKALEDMSYPHSKFAKVGGVSETELARLEISFCFLAGFELVVREETLQAHWTVLRDGNLAQALQAMEELPTTTSTTLRLDRKPREVVT